MITIKRATANDIPIIEDILLDAVVWLESLGRIQWGRDGVTWETLSKHYVPEDFYIAYFEDVQPMTIYNPLVVCKPLVAWR